MRSRYGWVEIQIQIVLKTFFSYYPFIIVITCIVIVRLSAEQITITSYTMDIIHIQLIRVQEEKLFATQQDQWDKKISIHNICIWNDTTKLCECTFCALCVFCVCKVLVASSTKTQPLFARIWPLSKECVHLMYYHLEWWFEIIGFWSKTIATGKVFACKLLDFIDSIG